MRKTDLNEKDYVNTLKKLLRKQVKTIEDAKEFERTYGVRVKRKKRLGKDTFGIFGVQKNSSFNLGNNIKIIQVKVNLDDYNYVMSIYGEDNMGNRQKFSLYLRQIIMQEIESLRTRDELNKKFDELFKRAANLELESIEKEKIREEAPELDLPELEKYEDVIYDELDDEEDKIDYGW